MTIQTHLDRLCKDNAGCSLTAFADMSSGLALRWSSQESCPREVLDDLCARATACFDLLDSEVQTTASDLSEMGSAVIHFTARKSRVFVRQSETSEDVICAVCESAHQIDPILRATKEAAVTIADEQ